MKTPKISDPLADPDTGRRIAFPKMPLRLTYDDIMGQRRPTLGPGSPDYITVYRRRTPSSAAGSKRVIAVKVKTNRRNSLAGPQPAQNDQSPQQARCSRIQRSYKRA